MPAIKMAANDLVLCCGIEIVAPVPLPRSALQEADDAPS
jgi:hypothetical protein